MFAASDFLTFNDHSPSPFHAVATVSAELEAAGFVRLAENDIWPSGTGKFFTIRGGSLIAWIEPEGVKKEAGFRILGAHTDSPNLRVKQNPDRTFAGLNLVALEPYGGPILNTWFDRDLGIAGRVVLSDLSERLVQIAEPVVRVSNLAIHLDRDKEQPNPQQHLNAMWSVGDVSFLGFVAQQLDLSESEIAGFELMAFDSSSASLIGPDKEFISAPRLDNLATVWAGMHALLAASSTRRNVGVFFDHEEVGSASERGAGSPFLTAVLERIVFAAGGERQDFHRALANSIVISGDMAHATHPNYVDKHEPRHQITMGGGPVLKVNTNLRYATDARGAAFFHAACTSVNVPMQRFMNRADLPCGSTIGPITAAGTGVLTVDVGAPQLAMHSIREMMVARDLEMYGQALLACLEIDGFDSQT